MVLAVPSQIISENNASQFNVMESAIDTKNVTTSNLQNSTFSVPSGWNFTQDRLNISAIYQSVELCQDGNLSTPGPNGSPWTFQTDI